MKKWMISISIITMLMVSTVTVHADPQYAKWGVIAVKETQKRYSADIIDYKHIGRITVSPVVTEERFKLWIRNREGKEFGVFVYIRFDTSSEKIKQIQFIESNQ